MVCSWMAMCLTKIFILFLPVGVENRYWGQLAVGSTSAILVGGKGKMIQ